MYEETLVLITGGVFSLTQICEAVLILSKFYPNDKKRSIEMTDSLWTGILSKDLELCDPKSVVAVFRTLPCLNQSRDLGVAHDMYLRIYQESMNLPIYQFFPCFLLRYRTFQLISKRTKMPLLLIISPKKVTFKPVEKQQTNFGLSKKFVKTCYELINSVQVGQ